MVVRMFVCVLSFTCDIVAFSVHHTLRRQGGQKKNWTIFLVIILVFDRYFRLTYLMLCDCDIEKKGFVIVVYFKTVPQRVNRWKFLHFFVRDTMWARCGTHTLSGYLTPTRFVAPRQEAHRQWRRCQQTCRQWSKDCCGLWQLKECHSKPAQEVHAPTCKQTCGWCGDCALNCCLT